MARNDSHSAAWNVASQMQRITDALSCSLSQIAGEPVSFVMAVWPNSGPERDLAVGGNGKPDDALAALESVLHSIRCESAQRELDFTVRGDLH
jgi:hypothetical protein